MTTSPELELLDATVAQIGGEHRAGQHDMVTAVASALTSGRPLLVQAGTGTGKSLGYLVPAALHASAEERVLVSTATIALQRQILSADLPAVTAAMTQAGQDVPDVALLKGWNNYVCRYKLTGGYPDEDDGLFQVPTSALGKQVVAVRQWAEETTTGDRDDLQPGVTDRAWAQVSISALECLGSQCPVREECFAVRAKEAAFAADIVVTNHSMLAVAATGSPGALPEFDALIVDEAHELVSRVTNTATVALSGGVIARVARSAARLGVKTDALVAAGDELGAWCAAADEGRIDEMPAELAAAVQAVRDELRAAMTALPSDADPAARKVAQSALVVLWEVAERLTGQDGSDVVWSTPDPGTLYAAPLDVSGQVAALVAERALVATSATLTVGGRFDPLAEAIGVGGDFDGLEVPSPFDYAKQGMIYVAAHLPPPKAVTPPEQLTEIADLIRASRGGALALFSSRAAADRAAEHCRAAFAEEGLDLPIGVQGEDSIANLVSDFAADHSASLFGTLSLWQGIDVPGGTCRLVIIDRIPFPRPDDPIWSARTRRAQAQGRNGFMAVSVPQAALLLAQGSGRLIRSTSDRGVVAVLDPRLAKASYGTILTTTMPPLWRTTDRDVVLAALARLATH